MDEGGLEELFGRLGRSGSVPEPGRRVVDGVMAELARPRASDGGPAGRRRLLAVSLVVVAGSVGVALAAAVNSAGPLGLSGAGQPPSLPLFQSAATAGLFGAR
jgi:hypothetical protein